MASTTSESRAYRASAPRLYAAALMTVPKLGYSIYYANATTRTVSFKTGMSMKSFGQDFTITVIEDTKDASTIIIGGGSDGAIFDWGEKTNTIHRVFETLSATLQNTPEPTQTTFHPAQYFVETTRQQRLRS